jgi:hypothetical protein
MRFLTSPSLGGVQPVRIEEVYLSDRLGRVVTLRRDDGLFELVEEWAEDPETGEAVPFAFDGQRPQSCLPNQARIGGLFGTLRDAQRERDAIASTRS